MAMFWIRKTIEKPRMVPWQKNIDHSIVLENWPSLWSRWRQSNDYQHSRHKSRKAFLTFNILAPAKFRHMRPSLDHSAARKKLIRKKPTIKSDLGKLVEILRKVANADKQIVGKKHLDKMCWRVPQHQAFNFVEGSFIWYSWPNWKLICQYAAFSHQSLPGKDWFNAAKLAVPILICWEGRIS